MIDGIAFQTNILALNAAVEAARAGEQGMALVDEISAASAGQSQGVDLVGKAVTQMDQATQHNAALVEQSAATAESLKQQAGDEIAADGHRPVGVARAFGDDAEAFGTTLAGQLQVVVPGDVGVRRTGQRQGQCSQGCGEGVFLCMIEGRDKPRPGNQGGLHAGGWGGVPG